MTGPRNIAVIDVGKTNVKVALVDLEEREELAVLTRPNIVKPGPPYPHFDTEGHWRFILSALSTLQDDHGIDAVSVTTHGASAALLAEDGSLATPILDYEHDGPEESAAEYDALRPAFAETGSPRLAGGLNVGAQLHWQFSRDAGLHDRTASILTYPQYWGHRLTGVVASDVTSMGCHTDLWKPRSGRLSVLVDRLGIREKLAPVRKPGDVLGTVLPDIAQFAGLRPGVPVACGIHDSNASLLPYVLRHHPPFNVVSTGTWVIVMSIGGTDVRPDPKRDALLNVNAFGHAVPSVRFMGGREFDIGQGDKPAGVTDAALTKVLENQIMLLPAIVADTGPYQGMQSRWVGVEPAVGEPTRAAALALYLAMMTATCLEISGGRGDNFVEGPFAENQLFLEMLAAATGQNTYAAAAKTGTAIGAAMLFSESTRALDVKRVKTLKHSKNMRRYAEAWRAAVD
ncbi:FGGY-family carbohydrate kinase [Roseobacter sp. EG26]|uniref:FGGY-family carbohydrate kinase n=1 Tax=Roseobacter sp. EG26 TaxID=3412477 RepID=UPI003CE5264D